MLKQLLSLFCIVFSLTTIHAQRNYWTNVNSQKVQTTQDDIIPYDFTLKKESYLQLDKAAISQFLLDAPLRDTHNNSEVIISLPNLDGGFDSFEMFKVQTLAPELAQKYPGINSYIGRSTDNREAGMVRITDTPHGFYTMIDKPDQGQFFINPYSKSGNFYVAFLKQDAEDLTHESCHFEDVNDISDGMYQDEDFQTFTVDDSTLRTYRFAIACTGEYAQYHIAQAGVGGGTTAQQVTAVLAALTVTTDRVNSIYERDLGSTLQIIANNDQIIFLNGSTDPYSNNDVFTMLGQNQSTLDSVISSSNYDLGHIVSTAPGGGVAALGSLCVPGAKAQGATGGINPVGDPFDIDFVSHEIGHQFGATHTQNNNCQRTAATAVEPGSGNTIMGYAGICPPNVQNNSDAHFHQISINQIYGNISSGNGSTCGTFSGQSNTPPAITPLPNYNIPNGTAFYLDVVATDAENDNLTYNWEQINNQISPSHPPLPTHTQGPNFRSLPSSSESRRYFPMFDEVLNNNLTPTWEVIPSVARSMNFAVTVRDNNINVGQSSREVVTVSFEGVGPFQVTSQNTSNINWLPGETRTISWDVAGTTANGINTSNVNILLSTNGGLTFDTVLASNTPNDGNHDIVVPSLQAGLCRIMVEAVNNVFYALNTTPFAIDTNVTTTCDNYVNNNPVSIPDGPGPNQQGPAVSSIINIPDNFTNISDVSVSLDVNHTYMSDLFFQMQAPNGDIIILWARNCDDENGFNLTFNDNGNALPASGTSCADPLTGTFQPASTSTDLATIFSNGTSGNWTLVFADFFNGDVGTLNSWEIEICSTTFSVEDNQLNSFTISPNPNNGIFTVSLTQSLSPNSEMNLYDIQGRFIEQLDFDPSSLTQNIELKSQVSTGTYLLEIMNQNGKSVNKLIIK